MIISTLLPEFTVMMLTGRKSPTDFGTMGPEWVEREIKKAEKQ